MTVRTFKKILIPSAIILVLAFAALFITAILNKRSIPVGANEDYGITADSLKEANSNPDVTNVVFLGIDQEENRSDVMMVVSINKKTKAVNVTSILRDSKVEIAGHAPTKLGFAYKWGGAKLALRTLNSNFGTAFDRFICMTFEDLANIIYAIGGVDVELTEEEADLVNDYAQVTGYTNWDAVPGWNTLGGDQAVAYARIRKLDSEYARAGRQQIVIKAMLAKVKSMSFTQYPQLIDMVLDSLETNLSYGELLELATIAAGDLSLYTHTIPDANYENGLFGGWVLNPDGGPEEDPVQWLWVYDLSMASKRLKMIMYDPEYWEDPNLPPGIWVWNELEDVIGDTGIDISDVNTDDVPVAIPETTEETTTTPPETTTPETTTGETTKESREETEETAPPETEAESKKETQKETPETTTESVTEPVTTGQEPTTTAEESSNEPTGTDEEESLPVESEEETPEESPDPEETES